MRTQLLPVEFDGDTVVMADFEGQPYVVMRGLATNMGLDWASQRVKLTEKFASSVVEIPSVADDGRVRSMVCLPLRKLPAWLYTLQPNKVKPELRDKVVRYQEECEEALYRFWTTGAQGAAGSAGADNGKLAWYKESSRLVSVLEQTKHQGTARALWCNLERINHTIGIKTESVDALAPILRQQALPGMGEGA